MEERQDTATGSGNAIAGFAVGIAGMFLFGSFGLLSRFIPAMAIFLSAAGLTELRRAEVARKRDQVLGWIGLALGIIYTFVGIVTFLGIR